MYVAPLGSIRIRWNSMWLPRDSYGFLVGFYLELVGIDLVSTWISWYSVWPLCGSYGIHVLLIWFLWSSIRFLCGSYWGFYMASVGIQCDPIWFPHGTYGTLFRLQMQLGRYRWNENGHTIATKLIHKGTHREKYRRIWGYSYNITKHLGIFLGV